MVDVGAVRTLWVVSADREAGVVIRLLDRGRVEVLRSLRF
jgi:hypothetical protein